MENFVQRANFILFIFHLKTFYMKKRMTKNFLGIRFKAEAYGVEANLSYIVQLCLKKHTTEI